MKRIILTLLFWVYASVTFSQSEDKDMVLVDGGTFIMGRETEPGYDSQFEHEVTVKSFYISKYEVTAKLYKQFSHYAGRDITNVEDNMAITGITWEEAVLFCNWYSEKKELDKYYDIEITDKGMQIKPIPNSNGYRLPTEAEWEWAARGSVESEHNTFAGSNKAEDVARYIKTGYRLYTVGSKKPNEIGVYDMSGNCSEWCWDYYDKNYYKNSPKENPQGPKNGINKVCRGGNFNCGEDNLRIATRKHYHPKTRKESIGFRLAKNPGGKATKMQRKF